MEKTMDVLPTKKAANVTGLPRRRQIRHSIMDVNHGIGSSQCCKSLNCSSTRLDCTNRGRISGPNTASSPLHAFSSKDVTGSSCRLISNPIGLRKTACRHQTPREVHFLSNRSRQESIKQPISASTPLEDHTMISERKISEDAKALQSSSPLKKRVPEKKNIPSTHAPRLQKRSVQRSDLRSQVHGSSSKKVISRHSGPSGSVGLISRATPCSPKATSSRYSNMRCSSTSNVLLPSKFSMSHSGKANRLLESNTNERTGGEKSTLRGKRFPSSSSTTMTNSRMMSTCRHNVSSATTPLSLEPRRSNDGCSTIRDGLRSARRRRVPSDIGNMGSEDSTSTVSLLKTSMHSTLSEPRLANCGSTAIYTPSSSFSSSTGVPQPYLDVDSYRTSESDEMDQDRPSIDLERSSNQESHDQSQAGRHFYLDGITEVLFAMERIEQDEELTYEQLVILETNLFLGGLAFHDPHRDMRLDIDHMTYEELLALEEKMGSVSTTISEEALSKCLRTSLYSSNPAASATRTRGDDKCSVCQEEYADEDEVAHLPCDHTYHLSCICVWLRLKNWCPICKAPVVRA